jgi:hypothetical protein
MKFLKTLFISFNFSKKRNLNSEKNYKRGTRVFPARALLIGLVILQACELNVNDVEKKFPENDINSFSTDVNVSALSYTFLMAQINLTVSPQATGDISLELRNQAGELITVASRPMATMSSKGIPTWYTFQSFTAFTYQPQTRLRLYVKRSDAHNEATGNTVFLSLSSGNDYLGGNSSVDGRDISFMTYKTVIDSERPQRKNLLDQTQTKVRERQPVLNNDYIWQEFIFGNSTSNAQVGLLNKISLPLSSPVAQQGNFIVQITNTQGNVVAEEVTIPASQIRMGNNPWTEFQLLNPLIVSFGQKYRFQFKHSCDPTSCSVPVPISIGHNENEEAYRLGRCNLSGDFAFKTFLQYPDQMQEIFPRLTFIQPNVTYWQEFVPGAN